MTLEKKQIGLQNIKRRLLKGGVWVTGGFVINALAALVIGALLARILSTEDVGLYFLAFSLVISGSSIVQFGITRTVVRLVASAVTAKQLGQARSVIVKAFFFVAVTSILVTGLLGSNVGTWLAATIFDNSRLSDYFFLLGLWLSASALRSIVAESFRGLHNIKMAALGLRILPNVLLSAIFIGMWFSGHIFSLSDVFIISVITGTVVFLYTGIKLYRHISAFPQTEGITLSGILRPSLPLFITQTLRIIMVQAPIWILGATQMEGELALFGTAARVSALIAMPILIANNVIMPMVASLYSSNEHEKLSRLLSASALLTAVPSSLIFIVFLFVGADVLELVFGNDYRGGINPLLILSAGLLFNVYAGSATVALAMTGNERRVLRSAIIATSISLGVGIVLIPQMGAVGAAIAASTGLGIYNIFLCWHCQDVLGLRTYVSLRGFREIYSVIAEKMRSKASTK